MLVLGLSGNFSAPDVDLVPGIPDWFFHDAAACLLKDGELVAAVEEERFNRIKHTTKFPIHAIRACLEIADVRPGDIDAVGHYFHQEFVDQMLNELYVDHTHAPTRYARELIRGWMGRELDWDLPDDRLAFTPHHVTHARSVFLRSALSEALVVVMDGRGEEHSGTIFHAEGDTLRTLATYDVFQSLGSLYEFCIQLLAYRFGDEYKVMGLAPYGDPATYRELFQSFYSLGDNGEYALMPRSYGFHPFAAPFFEAGFLPRRKGEPFTQAHKDFAAGVQEMFEAISMHVLRHWARETGLPNLCFVGGVAHNSTLNGLILRSGLFKQVYVHPASHDAGAAEGAAIAAAYQFGDKPYATPRLRSASLGPDLGDADQVEAAVRAWKGLVTYERPADIVETAAGLLADGKVLGWAQGRAEFGPRALGNRSILADARPAENKQRINAMVKKREGYRPFAPVVTPQDAATYFELPETVANYDFMSYVVDVHRERRAELGAVTHIDGSARVQIVDPTTNERFHRLVERFGALTGTPVLLNTSFNNNAEPIVQSVEDAVVCFLTTDLDHLVVEDLLVSRTSPVPVVDGLVPRFRPVTRLTARMRFAPERTTVHEISLDYNTGPSMEVSPATYALLSTIDGTLTVAELAGPDLTAEVRHELLQLWQGRYITLTPPRT